MPLELQIIRLGEFVRVGAHDRLDLKATRMVLAGLAAACRRRGIDRALLDIRDVPIGPKPVFSPDDLATLVNTFHEVGFTHEQRLALLYKSDPHDRAKLFAFIGTIRGWNVRAFDGYEEALLWLSDGDDGEGRQAGREQEVPLRQTDSKKLKVSATENQEGEQGQPAAE